MQVYGRQPNEVFRQTIRILGGQEEVDCATVQKDSNYVTTTTMWFMYAQPLFTDGVNEQVLGHLLGHQPRMMNKFCKLHQVVRRPAPGCPIGE